MKFHATVQRLWTCALFVAFAAPARATDTYIAYVLQPTDPNVLESTAYAAYGGKEYGFVDLYQNGGPGVVHAAMWQGTSRAITDLNSPGYQNSVIRSAFGNNQAGYAFNDNHPAPMLWHGTAASGHSVLPPGWVFGSLAATDGTLSVGGGDSGGGPTGAWLWTGDDSTPINLQPTWALGAGVVGAWNGYQVGLISSPGNYGHEHACVWQGTPDSAQDIHPTGNSWWLQDYSSQANAMWGNLVCGRFGFGNGVGGPTIWNLTAGTFTLLNMRGEVTCMGPGIQAGYVNDGDSHAMAWRGTAASAVDLGTFLPNYYYNSVAYGIDPTNGHIVGRASNGLYGGRTEAIMWVRRPGIPMPGTVIGH